MTIFFSAREAGSSEVAFSAMTFRSASLSSPIVASDDWYATADVLDATATESNQEWRELLTMHAAKTPIETGRLKQALARGVPMAMRTEVWLTFSGAGERMAQTPHVYDQLCKRVAAYHAARVGQPPSPKSPAGSSAATSTATEERAHKVLEQVEKDLRRTEVGSDADKLSAMRRVLCAFASFCPEVGYVQGMNFIVVALLRVFNEAQAFWMLALIVQDWLPEHFSHAMVGNHIDCRVLAKLTSEHLPRLAARLAALDVSVQLLTTRWFLCLWSSVLPVHALHRLWDLLFVIGPAGTMQAALACITLCEPSVLEARDIGDALTGVKEVLRLIGDDGEQLVQVALYRIAPISKEQLFAWRLHCRQLVVSEARHVQATRRLLKLQRASGFSLQELKLMARLCGPFTLLPTDAATSLLRLTIDYDGFVRVVRGLVPQWKTNGGPGSLIERLFAIFFQLPADGRHEADLELDRRDLTGVDMPDGDADGIGAIAGGGLLADVSAEGASVDERPRLSFEQLVHGLGWLLRGTSEKRAQLCYRCFEEGGGAGGSNGAIAGPVSRERFSSLLLTVYMMYEPSWPVSAEAHARISHEAEQFVTMMFELWDDGKSGVLDAITFDRAAHQHPLLVQAFQLEQLELPDSAPPLSSSPLGAAHLRVKNGVYLGLRPGAVSKLDDSYF